MSLLLILFLILFHFFVSRLKVNKNVTHTIMLGFSHEAVQFKPIMIVKKHP